MSDNEILYQDFVNSKFYKKYGKCYEVDSILKDIFGCQIRKKGIPGIGKMTYQEIYKRNLVVISDFIDLYLVGNRKITKKLAWRMLHSIYVDPDTAAVQMLHDVRCIADGIISIKRIFSYEGINIHLIEDYEKYRKNPIIFFPAEKNGINMLRASVFGDRIDYTLYDIKEYFKGSNVCKLQSAYNLPLTASWLSKYDKFEDLIDEFGLKGVFTNENYEIYDLERYDDSVIEGYEKSSLWKWTEQYYNNLKNKMEIYMEKYPQGKFKCD